jgi:hypothetical protein
MHVVQRNVHKRAILHRLFGWQQMERAKMPWAAAFPRSLTDGACENHWHDERRPGYLAAGCGRCLNKLVFMLNDHSP